MSNLLWACMHRGTMPQLRKVKPAQGGTTVIAEEMLEGRFEYPTVQIRGVRKVEVPTPPPSGVVGVTWSKPRQCWVARVHLNDKSYGAGGYATIIEATEARDRKLTELAKLDRSV